MDSIKSITQTLETVELPEGLFGGSGIGGSPMPTLSPLFVTHSISPVISPVLPAEFVVGVDSIIPPTVLKVDPQPHLGIIGMGTTMLIPSDIYIPSFSVVSNALRPTKTFLLEDVCDIPSIREKVTKLIYYKLLDKWLYDNDKSKYLLEYLTYSDGKVKLISSIDKTDDYKSNSKEVVDKKVDYIEKQIISVEDIYHILQRFSESTNVSWCDMNKDTFFIRDSIEKSIEKKFKRLIGDK